MEQTADTPGSGHLADRGLLLPKQLGDLDCGPNVFGDLWKQVQHAPANSTDKIFLEGGGFEAWLAYPVLVRKMCCRKERKICWESCFAGFSLVADLKMQPPEYTSAGGFFGLLARLQKQGGFPGLSAL